MSRGILSSSDAPLLEDDARSPGSRQKSRARAGNIVPKWTLKARIWTKPSQDVGVEGAESVLLMARRSRPKTS